ncbi:MAG: ATP-binding cassette domain-containing protein [Deltaproteobacteria bacterium]|nr:ATP-binding cassette domain-containing protein [Deltaproteobacteria bacterium]
MELSSHLEDKSNLREIGKAQAENAISIRDVKFRYTNRSPYVLKIENLRIQKGEKVAVIGPSGAGKTTLMRLINGVIEHESGEVKILGETFDNGSTKSRDFRRRIGFIYQDFNLIGRASVFENVLWGRVAYINPLFSLVGWFSIRDKQAALSAIDEVNLIGHMNQRADTLSGGQMQRVAIARVLAQEPEIILADEPVSNLDPALTDDILNLLVEVSENHKVTLLMNLHQTDLAQRLAERIIGLRGGEIVYDSSQERLFNHVPKSLFDPEVPPLKMSKNRN